ncbi:MAG: type II toxin-antitoxin system VapB family antitoxin [Fluviibacter sp.]|mgnify:FL=1
MTITTVFTNNRTQAVRLPADARLPESVKKVSIRIRGKERVIAPIEHTWDHFFLSGPQATEDFLESRGDQIDSARESF